MFVLADILQSMLESTFQQVLNHLSQDQQSHQLCKGKERKYFPFLLRTLPTLIVLLSSPRRIFHKMLAKTSKEKENETKREIELKNLQIKERVFFEEVCLKRKEDIL